MKTNTATTLDQSVRLLQCGVSADTADMFYQTPITVSQKAKREDILLVKKVDKKLYDTDIPAWSLSALLGLLPKKICDESGESYYFSLAQEYMVNADYHAAYKLCSDCDYDYIGRRSPHPIEACVQLIEWLMENNYKLNDMKPYRIKHIPTGLYYKPVVPNLSKTGKVYQTTNNALTYFCCGVVPVEVRKDSKIYEATKDKIQWEPSRYHYGYMIAKLPINEFEKEEL